MVLFVKFVLPYGDGVFRDSQLVVTGADDGAVSCDARQRRRVRAL